MPLDDESRTQLQVMLRRIPRILHVGLSPVEAFFSWILEPPGHRKKRRVYLTADGDVIGTEDITPPAPPEGRVVGDPKPFD